MALGLSVTALTDSTSHDSFPTLNSQSHFKDWRAGDHGGPGPGAETHMWGRKKARQGVSFGHGWVKQPLGLEQTSRVEKVKKKVTGSYWTSNMWKAEWRLQWLCSRTEDGKDGKMAAGRNASSTHQISTSNLGWTWLFHVEGSLPVESSYRAWSSPGWREWQIGWILRWWVD